MAENQVSTTFSSVISSTFSFLWSEVKMYIGSFWGGLKYAWITTPLMDHYTFRKFWVKKV